MTENEKIKVLHIGEQLGCLSKDIIQIELSPDWLEEIAIVFKYRAMHDTSYDKQGFNREKADFFDEAYQTWITARKEFDDNKGD